MYLAWLEASRLMVSHGSIKDSWLERTKCLFSVVYISVVYNGLFHSFVWIKLKLSVGVVGLTNLLPCKNNKKRQRRPGLNHSVIAQDIFKII